MEKRDEFEFDHAGELIENYISLDQAVLQARRLVRQDEARYLERLNWDEIVWAETSSERREDSYRVVLQFRRPARGLREEQTGEEEFLFDLTGVLQDRQVLLWPEGLIAGEGASDTTPVPEPEVTVPDAAEVELETSTTEPRLLQCTQCKTEYSPGQRFCNACGAGVSDATVSPPSTIPASTPYIRSDNRPTAAPLVLPSPQISGWVRRRIGKITERGVPHRNSAVSRSAQRREGVTTGPLGTKPAMGRASVTVWARRIAGILLGLWGALLLIVGGVDLTQEDQLIWGNLLIMLGGVATIAVAGLLWPWTKLHFGRLGNRWVITGMAVGGFVAFVVGATLTSE